MSAAERLIDSLAERFYRAHMEWRAGLSESAQVWSHWWALDGKLKVPYRDAARECIAREERKVVKA
jgi:hypothetical protein